MLVLYTKKLELFVTMDEEIVSVHREDTIPTKVGSKDHSAGCKLSQFEQKVVIVLYEMT